MRIIFIILAFLLLNSPVYSQTLSERLDSLITSLYNNNQFSGSIIVAEKGQIIYKKTVGWANFEKKDTLKETTSINIASITKPFTALSIIMLKERGLLDYDDPINKHLPENE